MDGSIFIDRAHIYVVGALNSLRLEGPEISAIKRFLQVLFSRMHHMLTFFFLLQALLELTQHHPTFAKRGMKYHWHSTRDGCCVAFAKTDLEHSSQPLGIVGGN